MRTEDINKFNEDTASELADILDMSVSYEYIKKQQAKFIIKNEYDQFVFEVGGKLKAFKPMSVSDILQEMLYIFKLDTEIFENTNEVFCREFKRQVINKTPIEIKYF